MPEPSVEVLGVYRVRATDDLIRDRIESLYEPDELKAKEGRIAAERECREFFESTVLIEALIHNRDARFDVGDFVQRVDGTSEDDWQVAYAEAYLTPDGASLVAERWTDEIPSGDLRIAFFMHSWDGSEPLASSYGDIVCPAAVAMPERLERLVPYENVD